MGGRVFGVLVVFLCLSKCENVARLNVVFPQLDAEGSKKPLPVPLMEPSSQSREQNTLNLMQLQSEVLRLQKILREHQESETVAPPVKTTTQSSTTTTVGSGVKSTFDFKSLQNEIDALQKELMEKQRETSDSKARTSEGIDQDGKGSNSSYFYFGDPVKSKRFDSANNQTKLRASDFDLFDESRFTINDNYNATSDVRYTYTDYQPYETNEEHKKEHHKDHHKEKEKAAREDDDFSILGSNKISGVVGLVSEFVKMLSSGDGKGIVSIILKLPTLFLKGILQSVVAVFSKHGLKGLLIRLLVPAIILLLINGLMFVMLWWMWDDVPCSKCDNFAKPFNTYSMSSYYTKQPNYSK